ncbi:MAG: hypothetical protein H0W58_00495 [Acidobacteria bacterium]|jgi:hypothetical protein|nr:hypothetical protein [Acidobacteriota bacterium]
MLGKNLIRKSVTFLTAVAVWSVFSTAVLAAPGSDTMGEITVTGQVTVNGQTAVSNSTIASGSTIVTGANSTAVINLGKAGRVELVSDTSLTLRFSSNSIVGVLSAGKVRVSNAPGIATSINTRNAAVIADAGQNNTFSVDVGCADEVRCTQTHVETTIGLVTLRSGSNDKQVAAGTDATFGNPSQTGCKPCLRPGIDVQTPIAGVSTGVLAAILIAAIGAVGAAIYLGSTGNDIEVGGPPPVVSPTR